MTSFSVLDLAPIIEGGDASQAIRNSADLAQLAERLGYERFWLAEHHNMAGIASAATSVVIGHVAAATSTIRMGAGGIMLPNHAPMAIAEQFGTLDAIYPGRIDLGLGRAPGSDQIAARAFRRTLSGDVDRFPHDVVELLNYFKPAQPGQTLQAVPGEGRPVQVWILGSSLFGASLAAALGLPFSFASHFAPAMLDEAVAIYRDRFKPSEYLAKPHLMLGRTVVAADTEAQARFQFTSTQQSFLRLRTGAPGRLPPPVRDFDEAQVSGYLGEALGSAIVGDRDQVRAGLTAFVEKHQPDEIIVAAQFYDHALRRRSYEIVAEAMGIGALQPA